MAIARNISINNETYELEPAKGQRVYVGTCSTAAATNPKVCTVEDFPVDENDKPYIGTEIVVKFDATNTSTSTSPKLNVNGTGEISIWYNNAVLASAKSAYAGYAHRYLHYVYDGTYWVFMGHSVDNNSTYSNVALGQGYAVQNNSAASATITATLGSYALTANGIVSVKFLYDVPANATLNINGKGAKAIYNKDAAITSGVINAGDTATFIYNTYYHLIAVDSWQDKQDAISDLATIRSGASKGATAIQQADLAAVATSGSYNDLTDKPVIPTAVTVDSTITQNGTNPVQGGAIYSALAGKEDRQRVIIDIQCEVNYIIGYSVGGNTITGEELYALCADPKKDVVLRIIGYDNNEDDDPDYSDDILYYRIEDSLSGEYEIQYFASWWNGMFLLVGLVIKSEGANIYFDAGIEEFSYVPTYREINNKPLSSDITLTASDVGAVPTTRTVNGKALSSNITLSASDVGALPSNTHIPADQVNSDWDAPSGVAQILNKPTFKTINGESIVGTGDIEAGSGDVATAFTITITSTTIEVQPMTGAMMTVGTDVSFQVV